MDGRWESLRERVSRPGVLYTLSVRVVSSRCSTVPRLGPALLRLTSMLPLVIMESSSVGPGTESLERPRLRVATDKPGRASVRSFLTADADRLGVAAVERRVRRVTGSSELSRALSTCFALNCGGVQLCSNM